MMAILQETKQIPAESKKMMSAWFEQADHFSFSNVPAPSAHPLPIR